MPRDTMVWLDWGELLHHPESLYLRAKADGLVVASAADRLRLAVCRAAALDHGRNPTALFLWLLRHPDADFCLRYEDQARRDLATSRLVSERPVATEPTEPQPLGALLGKYLKETP